MTRGSDGPGSGDARELFPEMILNEKPIWTGLYESVRDALFPPRLPPLELTKREVSYLLVTKANPRVAQIPRSEAAGLSLADGLPYLRGSNGTALSQVGWPEQDRSSYTAW